MSTSFKRNITASCFLIILCIEAVPLPAQTEIGAIEQFALSADRREALAELIPGTEDFYFFHVLHYQNQAQFPDAQAALDAWKTKLGDSQRIQDMTLRQYLLTYNENPTRALEFVRDQLGVSLNHAPPSRNQAALLPSTLDNSFLNVDQLLESLVAQDRSLGLIETDALRLVLRRPLAPDQLRALLSRLQRADWPGTVDRIAEELALKDTQGFGWAHVHSLLTLEQLEALLARQASLLENDNFVRTYSAKLAPAEGTSLADPDELRAYLMRLMAWSSRLPVTQNSLKALVLGNLLKLNLQQGIFDRPLFLDYLALPRNAVYYEPKLVQRLRVGMVELGYTMRPQIELPAIGNDQELVRAYLEHFLQANDNIEDLSKLINRAYLDQVLAETKILYGIGDPAGWYAKLNPSQQRELRDRVELRFAAQNAQRYQTSDAVKLQVDLKNIPQLLVKVYSINTLGYYRSHNTPIDTNLDLDGLVPNAQRRLDFTQPTDRRHREVIDLPELTGRGVWIVDLIGGGQRSRAFIEKGRLLALQRLSDNGHVIEIVDETGGAVTTAALELNGRLFRSDKNGRITVPYAEQAVTRNAILTDGDYASQIQLLHFAESYRLEGGFFVDRQAIVAGNQAQLAIQTRLECNGQQTSIQLLEKPELTITATDLDGIVTQQHIKDLVLSDTQELVHRFLVPQRLVALHFELKGVVHNQSRDLKDPVSIQQSVTCNGINRSSQIGDFYLKSTPTGYQLQVRGKNGESITNLPIHLSLKLNQFTQAQQYQVATNELGIVELGMLENVALFTASSSVVQPCTFTVPDAIRRWPSQVQVGLDSRLVFPLGAESVEVSDFSLLEIRRGTPVAERSQIMQLGVGQLQIEGLPPGDYLLNDHAGKQVVTIRVSDVVAKAYQGVGEFAVGNSRVMQIEERRQVTIRNIELVDEGLAVVVDGADAATRVHVVATPFTAQEGVVLPFKTMYPELGFQHRRDLRNYFQDSLRIDEEYRYILDRMGMKTYPGNMLSQPSVLVHPWEVSVTQNERQEAAAGDMPAPMAAMAAPEGERRGLTREVAVGQETGGKSFDFLQRPAVLATNLPLENGRLQLPLKDMQGYGQIIVQVVNASSSDSRRLVLPDAIVPVRDQRLERSFAEDQKLAQTQSIQIIPAGEKILLGDARSQRLQAYSSIAEVFELYSTLLKDSDLEKFRFLTQWPELTDAEKQNHYNEMACHELNFFLSQKDPEFFNRTVRPFIEQKLDKQLIDLWLLDRPLETYAELWKQPRLNTLERVLLAQRVATENVSVTRWLEDYVSANPIDPDLRQSRFETALRATGLDTAGLSSSFDANLSLMKEQDADRVASDDSLFGMGGGMGGYGAEASPRPQEELKRSSLGFGMQLGRSGGAMGKAPDRFYQSLDKTREWAEAQYYQVRLSDQTSDLITPNPFWAEYLANGGKPFLSENLDLVCNSLHDALCALAVIDLPIQSKSPAISVEENQLMVSSTIPFIAFLERIEEVETQDDGDTILVGHDIFLSEPSSDETINRPVQGQALLRGVPYRASIVLSNPTDKERRIEVLAQLPAGSLPLSGSKLTRSFAQQLGPYSTQQIEYAFYFPNIGEFSHYGVQVAENGTHRTATPFRTFRVLDEPENVDESTWGYVADWASNEKVLEFLQSHNLEQLDLSRIAFRMQSLTFFETVTQYLESVGRYDPTLWAYALKHNKRKQLSQFLMQNRTVIQKLGPVFESPLIELDPQEQMSYEHLDYRPLVVARSHQLGAKRRILNSSLHGQYHSFLFLLAHQAEISNDQRLQLCYYMLLQNRITEALEWFEGVNVDELETKMQYDYFAAYLDFYRGDYEGATKIAEQYSDYSVPRWRELFAQVQRQVAQRNAMLGGEAVQVDADFTADLSEQQRILMGARESQQAALAAKRPSLSLEQSGGRLVLKHRNLNEIRAKYYLMDIELLFSRNPFVVRGDEALPVIQPNFVEVIQVGPEESQELKLPDSVLNRNVLVEVTAAGLSSTQVLTANSLNVNLVEAQGLLQVQNSVDRTPVVAAYVKVYAKHNDGSTKFYKDGYTDLRGQFDFATLSTSDLDTVQRFAILVMEPELGAIVREAGVPTR